MDEFDKAIKRAENSAKVAEILAKISLAISGTTFVVLVLWLLVN